MTPFSELPALKKTPFLVQQEKFLALLIFTEGLGQFIFTHIHEKTIPAGPRVFLGSPGLWRVMTQRSGHVSRAPWRLEPLVVRQISLR